MNHLESTPGFISETTPTNVKLVATPLSPNESGIPNNTADIGLIKNNSCLVKVIEVEDQSMRSITTKEIDIATIETVTNQSCNDNNGSSNKDTFFAESSATARVNVLNTTVGKYSVFFFCFHQVDSRMVRPFPMSLY